MKNIKIILILVITFISSGCSAKYSLNIDENVLLSEVLIVSEQLSFMKNEIVSSMENSLDNQFVDCSNLTLNECNEKVYNGEKELLLKEYADKQIGILLQDYIFTYKDEVKYGTILSDREDSIDEQYYDVVYNNSINTNELENSILLSSSSNTNITQNNSTINISISNIDEKIFDKIDSLSVNISTVYSSINNNADKIVRENNKQIYTWNYTKDNINNANISLVLDASITIEKQNKVLNNTIMLIVIGGVVLFGLIIGLFLNKKSKQNNKI